MWGQPPPAVHRARARRLSSARSARGFWRGRGLRRFAGNFVCNAIRIVILRPAFLAGRRIYGLVGSSGDAGRLHRSFSAKKRHLRMTCGSRREQDALLLAVEAGRGVDAQPIPCGMDTPAVAVAVALAVDSGLKSCHSDQGRNLLSWTPRKSPRPAHNPPQPRGRAARPAPRPRYRRRT